MVVPPIFEWSGLIPHADIWITLQRALDNNLISDRFARLSTPREDVERILKESFLKAIEQAACTTKLEMVYSGISNSPEEGYTQLIGPNLRLGGSDALVDDKLYKDVTVCGYGGVWQGVRRVERACE